MIKLFIIVLTFNFSLLAYANEETVIRHFKAFHKKTVNNCIFLEVGAELSASCSPVMQITKRDHGRRKHTINLSLGSYQVSSATDRADAISQLESMIADKVHRVQHLLSPVISSQHNGRCYDEELVLNLYLNQNGEIFSDYASHTTQEFQIRCRRRFFI